MNLMKNIFELKQQTLKDSYEMKIKELNNKTGVLGVTIPSDIVKGIGLTTNDLVRYTVVPDDVGNVNIEMEIIKK